MSGSKPDAGVPTKDAGVAALQHWAAFVMTLGPGAAMGFYVATVGFYVANFESRVFFIAMAFCAYLPGPLVAFFAAAPGRQVRRALLADCDLLLPSGPAAIGPSRRCIGLDTHASDSCISACCWAGYWDSFLDGYHLFDTDGCSYGSSGHRLCHAR